VATSGFYYDPKDEQDKKLKQSLEVIAKREHRTISDTMKLMLWARAEPAARQPVSEVRSEHQEPRSRHCPIKRERTLSRLFRRVGPGSVHGLV
jgi:hypothetical protein